jgi:hypothetical protein
MGGGVGLAAKTPEISPVVRCTLYRALVFAEVIRCSCRSDLDRLVQRGVPAASAIRMPLGTSERPIQAKRISLAMVPGLLRGTVIRGVSTSSAKAFPGNIRISLVTTLPAYNR